MSVHPFPRIIATPSLRDADERILAALETLRGRTALHLARPRRWYGLLARQARARALRASNSIESIDISLEEAFAISGNPDEDQQVTEEWLAVLGYSQAMTFARIYGDETQRALDLSSLLSMHFMVQSHDLSRSPGQLRHGDIHVVDELGRTTYTGPNADDLPDLMAALMASVQERPTTLRDAVIAGAMAHLNLVMIHPFRDGNGRMSRILQSLQLYRAQVREADFVSVEEYLGRNTADYYDVLASVGGGRWNPSADALPWIEFMLTAHYRQAHSVQKRLWRGDRIAEVVDEAIDEGKAPDRAAPALEHAFTGFLLRNAVYRNIVGVSANLASRDLNALVRSGLLEVRGHKRGAHYLPGSQYRELLQSIHQDAEQRFPVRVDPYRRLAEGESLLEH